MIPTSPNSEGDVKEVVSESGGSDTQRADDIASSTQNFTGYAQRGISVTDMHNSKVFKASLNIDVEAIANRDWPIAVEGGPRKSFAVDHDTDPRQTWNLRYAGRGFSADAVDGTDALATRSISLEGLWQAEAEARLSFSPQKATSGRKSWSGEMSPRKGADPATGKGAGRWKGKYSNVALLPVANESEETCSRLEEGSPEFNVLPPVREACCGTSKTPNTLPVSLKFMNLIYSVSARLPSSWKDVRDWSDKLRFKGQEKVILHGVTGAVCPGEMLGVLGPSNSGKTTLLNILSGRLLKYEGTITHNDVSFVKAMNRRIGFVARNDILYPQLTVKETLVYAALLKLSQEYSLRGKLDRATDVMFELGLDKCRDMIIGSPYIHGASGGERKRVSIGCEILTDPSLLLLDEPTSGLDSTTAFHIVRVLRSLALGGQTVVSSIHQPSSVVYHMFDKILLLSEGHPVFYGKGTKALGYFEGIGFHPTFTTNPADFLVDLASGVTHDIEDLRRDSSPFVLIKERAKEEEGEKSQVKKILKDAYVAHLLQENRNELFAAQALTSDKAQIAYDTVEEGEWSSSWVEQYCILTRRSMKERRHENLSARKILETLALAIMAALVWLDSSESVEDQVGLLFFSTMVWGCFPLYTTIYTFPLERNMVRKERASGVYRLSAYFIAQMTVDIPLQLILPTVYTIIVYWMGGLKATAVAFFASWAALLLNVLVAHGLGLAIGALCLNLENAVHIASATMLVVLMTGGFFSKDISPALDWLKYISFTYHTMRLEVRSQFEPDQTYKCNTRNCRVADVKAVSAIGLSRSLNSVWALMAFVVAFRLMAYFALWRTKRLQ